MKRQVLWGTISLSLLMFVGCAKEAAVVPESEPRQEISQPQTRAGVVENAIYDATLDVWMAPDPNQPKNRAAQDGEPTHFALKIYPRTEAEQWEVEMMKDVLVSYIPFGMLQLTEDEKAKLVTKSAAHAPEIEVSPYTVTYDNTNATDGGSTEPQTLSIPILYTIWPADKPLPGDLEYVKDHEIRQPQMLQTMTRATTRAGMDYPVLVTTYDDVLHKSVPLVNTEVMVSGDHIFYDPYNGDPYRPGYWVTPYLSATTDANGYFDLSSYIDQLLRYTDPTLDYFSLSLTLICADPNNRWKITSNGSTAPLTTTVWELFEYEYNPDRAWINMGVSTARQEIEILRAVNYFFNDQTSIPVNTPSGGAIIIANSGSNSSAEGSFSYPSCNINIYNNGHSDSDVIGTTLHELGHLTHYRNNSNRYTNTDTFLRESFASYSGWFFGEAYYNSLGWSEPRFSDITGNGRQWWDMYDDSYFAWQGNDYFNGWYSPLFVDLTDTFNNGANSYLAPDDTIQGVQPSSIWNIITNSTTYFGAGQCRERIANLVGTQSGFSDWIDDFDTWASTYPLTVQ